MACISFYSVATKSIHSLEIVRRLTGQLECAAGRKIAQVEMQLMILFIVDSIFDLISV